MIPDSFHDFYVAGASAAAALIGLLFVAISVSRDRLAESARTQVNRIRARAALTAFTNALAVSLFALIPGVPIGNVVLAVSLVGLVFVAASVVSLVRLRPRAWSDVHDMLFIAGLTTVFVVQLVQGIALRRQHDESGPAQTIAILVAVCLLIGIERSYELIGGPSIGIGHEVRALIDPRTGNGKAADGDADRAS